MFYLSLEFPALVFYIFSLHPVILTFDTIFCGLFVLVPLKIQLVVVLVSVLKLVQKASVTKLTHFINPDA